MILIDVKRLIPIYGDCSNVNFTALLSGVLKGNVEFINREGYEKFEVVFIEGEKMTEFINSLPCDQYHVFCISCDASFKSPPKASKNIKLGVLPMYSTGFTFEKLSKALNIIYEIEYDSIYSKSIKIINEIQNSDEIEFINNEYGTSATLDLCAPFQRLYYFNQTGNIDWGQQTVLPNGEFSILTDYHGEYSYNSKFVLNGELLINGFPILHKGSCPCTSFQKPINCHNEECEVVTRSKITDLAQNFVFKRLSDIYHNKYIFHLKNGIVSEITPINEKDEFFYQIQELMNVDFQYQKIHEIGFGLLDRNYFFPENFLPNELLKGVHFGLGLTPYTDYHIDLACSALDISIKKNGIKQSFFHI